MKTFMKLSWLIPVFSILFFACAVITVNIYFPEKEVKKAFKDLEEELIGDTPPIKEGDKTTKPQSFFDKPVIQNIANIISPASAYAQDNEIFQLIKQMPEVKEAYAKIKERLPLIKELRGKGVVGEGNRGYLAIRGTLTPDEAAAVEAHNNDRKVVITAMAKAVVKTNKLPETASNINQAIPKAESIFAELRREKAQPGWWIQKPGGNWIKK